VQPTPQILAHLNAVSCPSTNSCVAVGSAGTGSDLNLAVHWNGTSWKAQPVPGAPGNLYGVSCTAPNACIAVGSFVGAGVAVGVTAQPFAAKWNGAAWVIQPTPNLTNGGSFSAVSCTSTNACTAVGFSSGATLVERWNGRKWSIQPSANPGGASTAALYGVSCTSSTACVAVGDTGGGTGSTKTIAEHWNGTAWSIQPTTTALQSSLRAVSCTSATACTGVGWTGDKTLAQRWNGTEWTTQPTPNQAGKRYNRLKAVSCPSETACVAAGDYNDPGSPSPAAWTWDGTAWAITTLPLPSGKPGGQLNGVSCVSTLLCTAVGLAYNGGPNGTTRSPLAERYS
jgi:hypothetical protein